MEGLKWIPPYKTKPIYHVGKSGKKYEWDGYCDGGHISKKALPDNDYPYTIEYGKPIKPKWMDYD